LLVSVWFTKGVKVSCAAYVVSDCSFPPVLANEVKDDAPILSVPECYDFSLANAQRPFVTLSLRQMSADVVLVLVPFSENNDGAQIFGTGSESNDFQNICRELRKLFANATLARATILLNFHHTRVSLNWGPKNAHRLLPFRSYCEDGT
jgi:hypothetical protein